MAEARGHGIEDEADAGQVRPRAVGAGRRPRPHGGVDGRPRGHRAAGLGRGHRPRAASGCSPGARAAAEAGAPESRSSSPRRDSGPSVSIVAQHSRPDSGGADAVLEQLLDELGSPERRPFTRGLATACLRRAERVTRPGPGARRSSMRSSATCPARATTPTGPRPTPSPRRSSSAWSGSAPRRFARLRGCTTSAWSTCRAGCLRSRRAS